MGARDVRKVDLPAGAYARPLGAPPRALEVLEVEHHHVAAVAAVAVQVAPGGGVRLHRRDDLKKAVTDREDRVRQAEHAHARVAKRLWESERCLQLARGALELTRDEHRLAKPHPRSAVAGVHARRPSGAQADGQRLELVYEG